MFIGYPCLNWSMNERPNRTFRLASYSDERFRETVAMNLRATEAILRWNLAEGFGYFRISSDLIPFASHPVCAVDWAAEFADDLARLGAYIRQHNMRIAMHPDQFTLINAKDPEIVARSVKELAWHACFLDAMGLDATARLQIHVGGVYGDHAASRERFVREFEKLPPAIAHRLTVENDDRHYSLEDCLWISDRTGIPVLFDVFHHSLHGDGRPVSDCLKQAARTWSKKAGRLLVDYSSQQPEKRPGTHADTLDDSDFSQFLAASKGTDFDVMLEIKDKETSARRALALAQSDPRLRKPCGKTERCKPSR
ncbi:MAG TPA: UV DNA damage repair endonuclease UvsE [Candidatus Ozemobacteraceae bacterium]|nr:UV DNA damage repair endonuclease UvsE [Candidatus Ozemobacteraceae bacterium]